METVLPGPRPPGALRDGVDCLAWGTWSTVPSGETLTPRSCLVSLYAEYRVCYLNNHPSTTNPHTVLRSNALSDFCMASQFFLKKILVEEVNVQSLIHDRIQVLNDSKCIALSGIFIPVHLPFAKEQNPSAQNKCFLGH